jgi:hypothetical protein
LILIAYFKLMRPKNNRALMWHEVMLDPKTGTGTFELDQHKNVNKGRVPSPSVSFVIKSPSSTTSRRRKA